MPLKILGIDPGSNMMGFAWREMDLESFEKVINRLYEKPFLFKEQHMYFDEKQKLILATKRLHLKGNNKVEHKLVYIADFIKNFLELVRPECIVLEDTYLNVNRVSAMKSGIYLQAIIKVEAGRLNNIPVFLVANKEWRKYLGLSKTDGKVKYIPIIANKANVRLEPDLPIDCYDALGLLLFGEGNVEVGD